MKALLLTLTLLNCGDTVTTHTGLAMGGRELNPVRNAIVLDVVRGADTVALWTLAPRLEKRSPKLTRAAVIGAVVLEAFVVAHNARELQRQAHYNRGTR